MTPACTTQNATPVLKLEITRANTMAPLHTDRAVNLVLAHTTRPLVSNKQKKKEKKSQSIKIVNVKLENLGIFSLKPFRIDSIRETQTVTKEVMIAKENFPWIISIRKKYCNTTKL